MPAIIITDTHCGVHGASALWHNINLKVFQHLRDTCVKRNISEIIHLGDWFHDRKALNLQTMQTTLNVMEILRDFQLRILIGNHDIFYKNQPKPTSLDMMQEFSNVNIIDKVEKINIDGYDITLAPWTTNEIPKCEILFGHFEITGFGLPVNFKHNIGDFENCGQVYSGHFHFPMEQSNIRYIGAPYHMNFGESGDHRGYYIFDHGNLEMIEFNDYPRFKKIIASENINENEVKDNIVKLIFTQDFGNNINTQILEMVQSFKPIQMYTDFSQMLSVNEEQSQYIENFNVKSSKEILFDYIDLKTHPEHLKPQLLKRVVDSLTGELYE